ncbi:MAG: 5'/3'-nucleotidase SurE [Prevotella sp.]|nr:5'/3'-nucleotidase SurE [Prevotella sp.]
MKIKKPLILISNDDGFQAKGINVLIDTLRDIADLLVCAPDSGRSGYGCAFSVFNPLHLKLRRKEKGLEVWSCDGTPVDCVKLALDQLCTKRKPDMVIGGINHGDNASVNTHYSGTMGVAMEGAMKYIPSVAFSLCDHAEDADFDPLLPYIRHITQKVLEKGLPEGVCLNVNFPVAKKFKGVKVCRMAKGTWGNECVRSIHPRGSEYFWMVGSYVNDEPKAKDTDNWALTHGYVAITPTRVDVTAYETMEKIKQWTDNIDVQSADTIDRSLF